MLPYTVEKFIATYLSFSFQNVPVDSCLYLLECARQKNLKSKSSFGS